MCGVIVVDAGRSRSTNLGGDAYIMIIAWISSWVFEVLSIAQQYICSPTVCYFSREKPLVKPTAPGSLSHIFAFATYFSFAFIFRSVKLKIQKYFAALYFICDLFIQSITTFLPSRTNFWHRYPKGIDPLTRRVARICYLCAGAVYVVLLGSPTGSITLVS